MAAAENGEGRSRYAACIQCAQLCHQAHGQGLPSSRIPSFYSVLPSSPPSTSLTLPLPPAFLGGRGVRIDIESAPQEPLVSEVRLEGPSREIWNVTMQGRTLRDLAFTKGWDSFVKDHGLSVGDLLLFKLLSKGFFSVTIYGIDGCEKADAFMVRNSSTRSMASAQVTKKRLAAEEVPADVEAKRTKAGGVKQIAPLVIDLENDEDDVIILTEVETANATQSTRLKGDCISSFGSIINNLDAQEEEPGRAENVCEPPCAQHTSPPGMPCTEQVTGCSQDMREDTQSHLNLVELPPTPNNADKSNTEERPPLIASKAECDSPNEDTSESTDEEEAPSSDESENEDYDSCRQCVKPAEESLYKRTGAMDSPDVLNESQQRDRLNALLAKDYMTEAFISKRRPVSAAEREKALLAAKRFKSNKPFLRKLMKESHVYRGFWLGLSSDFSSEHLPTEVQGVTLLDESGKAWSAKWLGRRNGLSGGWRKFSLDHGLEEGDFCVFELIDKNRLVIKVHIFRVVELKDKLPGRAHYLRKPQSREWYVAGSSSRSSMGYKAKTSSGPSKKMRGAIASSKNACSVAKLLHCTEPRPETQRPNPLGKGVVRRLDPLFKRSENSTLHPVSAKVTTLKAASNSSAKEDTTDSTAKASKIYYTVQRLYNRRRGSVEDEFLVELKGIDTLTAVRTRVKRDGKAWWVPLSHFTSNKDACYL